MLVEKRDFSYPLHSTPPLRGVPVGVLTSRMVGLQKN